MCHAVISFNSLLPGSACGRKNIFIQGEPDQPRITSSGGCWVCLKAQDTEPFGLTFTP